MNESIKNLIPNISQISKGDLRKSINLLETLSLSSNISTDEIKKYFYFLTDKIDKIYIQDLLNVMNEGNLIGIREKIKDIGQKEFKRLYRETPHLFYSKSFFKKLGKKYNFSTKISKQALKRYKNSKSVGEDLLKTGSKNEVFTKHVKPNDPCPCGSGKKYKKCCANKLN